MASDAPTVNPEIVLSREDNYQTKFYHLAAGKSAAF
jgi:hypothetical protein